MLEDVVCEFIKNLELEQIKNICNYNYFVILMDLDLPDISGIDITKKIRAIEAINIKHTIIIASTQATTAVYARVANDHVRDVLKITENYC